VHGEIAIPPAGRGCPRSRSASSVARVKLSKTYRRPSALAVQMSVGNARLGHCGRILAPAGQGRSLSLRVRGEA
jgi:hypothetical protein